MNPSQDGRMLYRLLDGELGPADAAALRARIDVEPALRAEFEAQQRLRAGFAAARGGATSPSAGFTANVLAAARRLPSRRELEEADVGESIVRLCRRLLLAAAVVIGVGCVVYGGLLDHVFSNRSGNSLEAAPDDAQRELDRLDALIQSGAIDERKAK